MQKITINRTKRILAGHVWIFSNELLTSPKGYGSGELVEVYSKSDDFIGIGYINPASLISIRLLTRQKETINSDFFLRRISSAYALRQQLLEDTSSCRVIFSESDALPGLIVDKYNDALCVQILTAGMQRLSETVLDCLDEFFKPKCIFLRNESRARQLEGLPLHKSVFKGSAEYCTTIKEGSACIEIMPFEGQKTGFFLDQRANRLYFHKLLKPSLKGLDLFSYIGAWSLQASLKGAEVIAVDESSYAMQRAIRNSSLNQVQDRCTFIKSDVFTFLEAELQRGACYDYIVLDPPAFAKNKASVSNALKAYRDINAKAMRLLKPGGLLITSSCSQHISKEDFVNTLRLALRDAHKQKSILLCLKAQAPDHPISLSIPETEYLKCAFIVIR